MRHLVHRAACDVGVTHRCLVAFAVHLRYVEDDVLFAELTAGFHDYSHLTRLAYGNRSVKVDGEWTFALLGLDIIKGVRDVAHLRIAVIAEPYGDSRFGVGEFYEHVADRHRCHGIPCLTAYSREQTKQC